MNIADLIVILLLAASLAAAFWLMLHGKRGCCHDCSRCGDCQKKEKHK